MAKARNHEVTSSRAASAAARVLRNPKSSARAKTASKLLLRLLSAQIGKSKAIPSLLVALVLSSHKMSLIKIMGGFVFCVLPLSRIKLSFCRRR